ncbi:CrcB-like protein [Purpureocillium lavendulum]|uniref:CrcB-like protein n=1 Tax=Purpureocillium lavendulum TaxID=1247861 RepID=A0AB34FRK1_9HYPO|nr:CrcB-like protein [Purpureocillium lavendulum]
MSAQSPSQDEPARDGSAPSGPRRRQSETGSYDAPECYRNVDDVHTAVPEADPASGYLRRITTEECRECARDDEHAHAHEHEHEHGHVHEEPPVSSRRRRSSMDRQLARKPSSCSSRRLQRRPSVADEDNYTMPDCWANLNELAAGSPVQNVTDGPIYRHHSLEETRSHDQEYRRSHSSRRKRGAAAPAGQPEPPSEPKDDVEKAPTKRHISALATQIYTLSYLVFFSLLGTLARIGLTALTHYPDTPVIFTTIWANFGGSLIMGFLGEDRMLFRYEWGTPTYDRVLERAKRDDEESGGGSNGSSGPSPAATEVVANLAAAKKAHLATKKTIPLYIGLATGFCGSFTSFSTFIRDVFLAMSNDLVAPEFGTHAVSRNGGYSFMAMLAVIITTVCLSLGGLFVGAHIALASERFIPSIPFPFTRRVLDPLMVFLGWGCWLGAVLLSIFPPHDNWRGRATFALVFAPLGCLLRFYLSLWLNGRIAGFPLGTFAANVFGTAVLGMAWDIANVPIGGLVGCQVLQGVEDGFCGCLTTVSTWVAELSSLRRKNAYVYGTASVLAAFAVMVAVMGGLRWTDGFAALSCH